MTITCDNCCRKDATIRDQVDYMREIREKVKELSTMCDAYDYSPNYCIPAGIISDINEILSLMEDV